MRVLIGVLVLLASSAFSASGQVRSLELKFEKKNCGPECIEDFKAVVKDLHGVEVQSVKTLGAYHIASVNLPASAFALPHTLQNKLHTKRILWTRIVYQVEGTITSDWKLQYANTMLLLNPQPSIKAGPGVFFLEYAGDRIANASGFNPNANDSTAAYNILSQASFEKQFK